MFGKKNEYLACKHSKTNLLKKKKTKHFFFQRIKDHTVVKASSKELFMIAVF